MPNVLMGQRVMERVRDYFKEGLKSSNKRYAADRAGQDVPDTDKARTRAQHQHTAADYLYQLKKGFQDSGQTGSAKSAEWFLDLEASVRAGNCGEMAQVAAYYANNDEHVAADRIYLGVILPPGEHVFCLITDAAIPPAQREKGALFGFCQNEANHLIIDPWLHTACLTGVYIKETKARLTKWQAAGKRIAWGGLDGKARGWYPPSELYKQAMQRSPVRLIPYA